MKSQLTQLITILPCLLREVGTSGTLNFVNLFANSQKFTYVRITDLIFIFLQSMTQVESAVIHQKPAQSRTQWTARRTGSGVERGLDTWMFRKFVPSLRSAAPYQR